MMKRELKTLGTGPVKNVFDVLVICLDCKKESEIKVPQEAKQGLNCYFCGSEKIDWEKI